MWESLIPAGLNLLGGLFNSNSASDAAEAQANAQRDAARIAADAARFRPVGITNRFGSSKFEFDKQGNLSGAGYTLSPEMRQYQEQMMGMLGSGMNQYHQGQQQSQPLMQGAADMMSLGRGYIQQDPQAQAAQYLAQQQALLQPYRQREDAAMRQQLFNAGRGGLAVGATDTLRGANPEQEALYNARMMQDLQLAAQAQQGAQANAKFGAGMLGSGGDMMSAYYQNQVNAMQPFNATLAASQGIENLGKENLLTGMSLGGQQAAAGAVQGGMLQRGYGDAASTIGQTAQAVGSPWGNLLQGAGQAFKDYRSQQPQQPQYLGAGIWNKAGNDRLAWIDSQDPVLNNY